MNADEITERQVARVRELTHLTEEQLLARARGG